MVKTIVLILNNLATDKIYSVCFTFFFLDISNQANLLLTNLKILVDKLQAKTTYFQIQVEKLQIEKKQLLISNKKLSNKVNSLEKEIKELK